MIAGQRETASVLTTHPQTVATNATTTVLFDAQGANDVSFVIVGDVASSTNGYKLTVLNVVEGDTTVLSNATSITGGDGTTNSTATTSQFVIPTVANTSVANTIKLNVPTHGKKRYIGVALRSPDTTHDNYTVVALKNPGVDSSSGQNISFA